MTTPRYRPHHLLIILWAEGHPVDARSLNGNWFRINTPAWESDGTYSIKLATHRIISSPNGVTFESLPQP